jgi:hypothetical protein
MMFNEGAKLSQVSFEETLMHIVIAPVSRLGRPVQQP